MEIKDAIRSAFKEWILPELDRIKDDNTQIKVMLESTNKRLDDINLHLVDQSRRIDAVRTEISQQITDVRTELGQQITDVRTELGQLVRETRTDLTGRMDGINSRLDETNQVVGQVRHDLSMRMDRISKDMINQRERESLMERIQHLEYRYAAIEQRLPA